MHDRHSNPHDVIIAGAGPVGLFLALELRLTGLSVLVLEQAEDPRSPLKRLPFGMRGLSVPTVEALYRRGLLDDVAAAQHANDASPRSTVASAHWMRQSRRPAGHFAGIQFFHDSIDTSRWPYRLPSPASTGMAVDMETLESVLATRAGTMGVEIRRGFGVEDLDQSDDEVTPAVRRLGGAGSSVAMAAAARFARRQALNSSAPILSSPAIPSKSRWLIRISSGRAATTRRQACIRMRSRGRSRWSRSTAALSIEPSPSRLTMCRRYCAVSPAPM